jgi:AraC-like DNA-binding protein
MYPSSLSSWTLLIAKGLESLGLDADALFRMAGLDPEKLRVPGARFNQAAVIKLWQIAEQASHDPYFGIHISRYWHPTTFHALGYAWLASNSLKDGFRRLVRYSAIVNNKLNVEFQLENDGYRFSFASTTLPPGALPVAIDAGLSTVIHMCRMNFGDELNPISMFTTRPRPASITPHETFFNCPITFASETNMLYFAPADIEKRLPTSNAELALKSDQMAMEYLARYQHDDIILKIKSLLINRWPGGRISESEIADALNVSTRTLHRKLQSEGLNINMLLDETRKELAIHYLENSTLTIGEIAYLLGFSEPANFSRAFRRWTGTTPNAYRSARPLPFSGRPTSTVSIQPPA